MESTRKKVVEKKWLCRSKGFLLTHNTKQESEYSKVKFSRFLFQVALFSRVSFMISQAISNEATSSEVMASGEKEKKEFQKQKKEIKVIEKSEMG